MRGASFDNLSGQVDIHGGFVIADSLYFIRGDLHLSTGKPAGFDHQSSYGPTPGIHHKIADVAYLSVAGLKAISANIKSAS